MNNIGETHFEQKLNSILGADINNALDDLDGGEPEKLQLPVTVEYKEVSTVVDDNQELSKDLVDDYKHVRNTLYGLIERGTVALEGALIIARESEHPKAFEVCSTLMRDISTTAKDLLKLQEKLTTGPQSIGTQVNKQTNIYLSNDSDPKTINKFLDDLE